MRSIFIILCFALPVSVHAQLAISEVHWAGSPVSTADEWFEVINISDAELDLTGWTVTSRKSDGSDAVMLTFEDILLMPGEVLLVANYAADQSALAVHPHIVTTEVSLPNTKLLLQIFDDEGTLIDTVDDYTGAPFAGITSPHSSMERIDYLASGTIKENWRTAVESIGFDPDQLVYGTPGVAPDSKDSNDGKDSKESSASSESFGSFGSFGSFASFESSSSVTYFPSIRITEVLSNPAGNEDYEWIELGNLGSDAVNISGWELRDESAAYVIIPRDADGYVLVPGEHVLFFGYQTGLSLSNAGEILTLFQGSDEVNRLPYGETGEQISFGRTAEGQLAAYCVPTPRAMNERLPTDPHIEIQSGQVTDYVKVTLNLEAVAKKGTLTKAQCLWNFRDGTTSEKCNPPSHSLDYPGVYEITLRVLTYCGEEIERKLEAVVLEKKAKNLKTVKNESSHSLSSTSSKSLKSPISSRKSSPINNSTSSGKYNEQKSYSSKSSPMSSRNTIEMLPVRYVNLRDPDAYFRDGSAGSNPIDERIYSLMEANLQQTEPGKGSAENGFPWLLLFSQSALWLILAGKKWI